MLTPSQLRHAAASCSHILGLHHAAASWDCVMQPHCITASLHCITASCSCVVLLSACCCSAPDAACSFIVKPHCGHSIARAGALHARSGSRPRIQRRLHCTHARIAHTWRTPHHAAAVCSCICAIRVPAEPVAFSRACGHEGGCDHSGGRRPCGLGSLPEGRLGPGPDRLDRVAHPQSLAADQAPCLHDTEPGIGCDHGVR